MHSRFRSSPHVSPRLESRSASMAVAPRGSFADFSNISETNSRSIDGARCQSCAARIRNHGDGDAGPWRWGDPKPHVSPDREATARRWRQRQGECNGVDCAKRLDMYGVYRWRWLRQAEIAARTPPLDMVDKAVAGALDRAVEQAAALVDTVEDVELEELPLGLSLNGPRSADMQLLRLARRLMPEGTVQALAVSSPDRRRALADHRAGRRMPPRGRCARAPAHRHGPRP